MGKKKIYRLDNGKIKMTMQEMIDQTQLGRSAIQERLKQSKKSELVLAPRGKHSANLLAKQKLLKAKKKAKKMAISDIYKNPEKIEKKKKAEQILKNHPFYDLGEKGKLHRLLFGKWFGGKNEHWNTK